MKNKGLNYKNIKQFLQRKKSNVALSGNPSYQNGIIITSGTKLIIPQSQLPPQQGTIELKIDIKLDGSVRYYYHSTPDGTNNVILIYKNSSNNIYFFLRGPNGDTQNLGPWTITEGIHRFAITYHRWEFRFFIDGIYKGITTLQNPSILPVPSSDIAVGSNYNGTNYFANTGIQEVIHSSIPRSDSNIQSRADDKAGFQIDEYVIFALPLQGNTGAYSFKYPPENNPIHSIVSATTTKCEAWPSTVQLQDSTIIVLYRTSDTNEDGFDATGKVVIRKSTDNGKTWGSEITVVKMGTNLDNRNQALLLYDNDGVETLLCTFTTYDGTNPQNTYCTQSVDGGTNWSTPVLVKNGRVSQTNPIQLSNGDIVFATYSDPAGGNLQIQRSTDNGENWNESTLISGDARYPNETALIELKTGGIFQGKVMAISRAELGYNYVKYISNDYAETWDSGTYISSFPGIYQKTRVALSRVHDEIVAVYTDYYKKVFVCKSKDEGTSWTNNKELFTAISATEYPEIILLNTNQLGMSWCSNGNNSDIFFTRFNNF